MIQDEPNNGDIINEAVDALNSNEEENVWERVPYLRPYITKKGFLTKKVVIKIQKIVDTVLTTKN